MINAIKTYLIANGITATITVGFTPPTPNTHITLFETPGFAPDPKLQDNTLSFQVNCRASDYTTARDLIYSVFNILQSLSSASLGTNIGSFFVVQCLAQQDPYALGRDDNDRPQFVQNYLVQYNLDLQHRH